MLAQWQQSYNRAAPMQSGLAMASALFGFAAAWVTRDPRWIAGAVLILANWPFTLLAIKPTNDRLHAAVPEQADAEARRLVVAWGRLHAWRSALGVAGAAAYLWAMH